jgi:hypothetical protein
LLLTLFPHPTKIMKTHGTFLKKAEPVAGLGSSTSTDVPTIMRGVIDDIRRDGDLAVRRYSDKFDKWSPPSLKLSEAEIERIMASVPQQTLDDIKYRPTCGASPRHSAIRSRTLRSRRLRECSSARGTTQSTLWERELSPYTYID